MSIDILHKEKARMLIGEEGFMKLTHSGPEVTEMAESKRSEPNGPTLAFSTLEPVAVRSSLIASRWPLKPISCKFILS